MSAEDGQNVGVGDITPLADPQLPILPPPGAGVAPGAGGGGPVQLPPPQPAVSSSNGNNNKSGLSDDDDDSDKGDEDVPMTFPQRMMDILSQEKYSDIITWLPHGRGFVILQKKRFANEIMPKYFNKKSKFTSFTRKLNRWNFTRVTRGPETGAYYHPLFQKGNLRLCMQMSCISSKSAQQLQPMNPVALGLTMPQPGQPMGPGMMPMPGDAEGNFMRLRQLEEQRQNLLLQQQKQQQQLMALAGFGGPGGDPAQVGSTPGAVPAPGMPPGTNPPQPGQQPGQPPQPGQPQPQPQPGQPGQPQQMPNGQPNPMAANPYIAMLMQQGMMNPQQMQMNGGQPPNGQYNGMQMMPMQMNPAMQAQFFALQQQNAMMQAHQQPPPKPGQPPQQPQMPGQPEQPQQPPLPPGQPQQQPGQPPPPLQPGQQPPPPPHQPQMQMQQPPPQLDPQQQQQMQQFQQQQHMAAMAAAAGQNNMMGNPAMPPQQMQQQQQQEPVKEEGQPQDNEGNK